MSDVLTMDSIWSVSEHNFNDCALELFHYQSQNNVIYSTYLNLIDKNPNSIDHYTKIPCLPLPFFQSQVVKTGKFKEEHIFESSGTTSHNVSKHYVKSLDEYHQNALKIIEERFDSIKTFKVLGLLPNYLEKGNSSLVSMVNYLMKHQEPKFFLYNHDELKAELNLPGKKMLFGVSFALLDYAENYSHDSDDLVIIETGGMKGRKKEITKMEVYQLLKNAFPKAQIISEYGMTELMSQAYSDEKGIYAPPPWMKVLSRSATDPFATDLTSSTSALNIIDLANINTCAFLATDDLGKVHKDGKFEVLGRLDAADIRGCSQLV